MKWTNGRKWLKPAAAAALASTVVLLLFATTGCRRTDRGPDPDTTSTRPDEDRQEKPAPQPMDVEDHPDAPRAFPRSSEVQSWVKTGAVQVAPATEMAGFVPDPQVRRMLQAYQLARLARATYESAYATAELLLVEAATPEDALGIFSMENSGASCSQEEDGSLRAAGNLNGRLLLTAWQGHVFLRMLCQPGPDAREARRDCERLLSRTVFGVPMADPPLLMRAVKDVQQEQCRIWAVRSTAGLRQQRLPRLQQLQSDTLDQRLGLDGQAILSVVAVEQTRGVAPIIIWLARYPAPEQAQAAAARYAAALESPQDVDHVTVISAPVGPFLAGTWTADQPAAREMIKLLEEVLPDAPEALNSTRSANSS